MPKNFLPDLQYLPEALTTIDAKTKLCQGVTLGQFTGNTGLDHISSLEEKRQIARNLIPHAQILRSIRNNTKRFAQHTLVVVEGVYKPAPEEQITESETNHNFLATKGRGVVYELRHNNRIDLEKTVELVRHLQIFNRFYDKIILDYDTINEGELNAQIVIQTPEIPPTYNPKFKNVAETIFNGAPQATGQLVEVTEIPDTKISFPAPLPDEVQGYFTLGDLHSRLIRVYGGSPWQSYALDTRTSRDTVIKENLRKIKSGEIVVLSAGYNDALTTSDTPQSIGERVRSIVKLSLDLDHVVTFLIFPITSKMPTQRSVQVRNSIINSLNAFSNVRLVDLNDSQYTLDLDGQQLTKESYISISNLLI